MFRKLDLMFNNKYASSTGTRVKPIVVVLLAAMLLMACQAVPQTPDVTDDLSTAVEAFSTPEVVTVELDNYGKAPEIHNTVWLNTDEALQLKDLRGSVVLLEMWTFGCINCKNVIPSLKEWHEKYKDQGLVIIGNHYPEFAFERDWNNVRQAVADYGIEYPVAQDNDGQTWRAYENRYWPALF